MRKLLAISIIFFVFSSLPELCNADGYSLLKQCSDAIDYTDGKKGGAEVEINTIYCHGVLYGVAATVFLYDKYLPKSNKYCAPFDRMRGNQALGIVVNFLRDNPKLLDKDDAELVVRAFMKSYPCK